MKRALLTLIVAVACGVTALAAIHFKHGITWTDLGVSLESSGALAGLGNGDVLVTLIAQANASTVCVNPGGHQPPGRNPGPVTVSGSQAIPDSETKNGSTSFDVKTVALPSEIPGAPDCPNRHWTELITDHGFFHAVLGVEQNGVAVLSLDCVFDPPTTNGVISRDAVSCQ